MPGHKRKEEEKEEEEEPRHATPRHATQRKPSHCKESHCMTARLREVVEAARKAGVCGEDVLHTLPRHHRHLRVYPRLPWR